MVYIISDGSRVKIGWSRNPEKRLKQLQTGNPSKLKLLKVYDVLRVKERYLHKSLMLYKTRHNGEWFDISATLIIDILDSLLDHATLY
jgi:hypothetical protein